MPEETELLLKLIPIIKRIPWYCGNPACINDACHAIREARDLLREAFNSGLLTRLDKETYPNDPYTPTTRCRGSTRS